MIKHGEVLYTYDWRRGYTKRVAVPFRFRYDSVPGILGHALARTEAYLTRLSVTYALFDCSAVVCPEHMCSGLVVA